MKKGIEHLPSRYTIVMRFERYLIPPSWTKRDHQNLIFGNELQERLTRFERLVECEQEDRCGRPG